MNNSRDQSIEVDELRAVIAAALLGLDEDDDDPPEIAVTYEGRDLAVLGVTYDATRNRVYVHVDRSRSWSRNRVNLSDEFAMKLMDEKSIRLKPW